MNARRTLNERLSTQPALTGLLQAHPSPTLTEMAGVCGYDFVMLDDEHGLFDRTDYVHAVQALAGTGALSFIRLANHDSNTVGRFLDLGVDGIVAPNVTSASQAEALVRAMLYPPEGVRGVGAPLHRTTCYGSDYAAHLRSPRKGVSLLVIIECALGIANVEDILSVAGVDGAIVGPADLSASLGRPGDFFQPGYADALETVERAARATGKVLGTAPHAGYSLEALSARGHRLFILGSDASLIGEAMRTQVSGASRAIASALQSTLETNE